MRSGGARSCGCLKAAAQKNLGAIGAAFTKARTDLKPILVGDRHGTLLVTNPQARPSSDGSWMVELKCDCGHVLEAYSHWVRKSAITTCRRRECPYRAERKRHGALAEDMTGKTLGFLTVVGPGPYAIMKGSGRSIMRWLCRCLCGREVLRYRSGLKDRPVLSCGCVTGRLYKPGEKHYSITILGYVAEEGAIFYLTRCACGAEKRLRCMHPATMPRSCGCGGVVTLLGQTITAAQLAKIVGSPLHSVLRNLSRTTPDRMILPRKAKRKDGRARGGKS